MQRERELEVERQIDGLLGADLSHMLRAATDALERIAPAEFEAIGAKSINLDALLLRARAASALPELMAHYRVIAAVEGDQARGAVHAARPDESVAAPLAMTNVQPALRRALLTDLLARAS